MSTTPTHREIGGGRRPVRHVGRTMRSVSGREMKFHSVHFHNNLATGETKMEVRYRPVTQAEKPAASSMARVLFPLWLRARVAS